MGGNRALLATLVALPLCAAGSFSAHAQEQPAPDENPSGKPDQAKAQELYNAGLRAYNVGNFDQAISDWKAAYQFMGVPDFLFNIAQAYRQKKEYGEAVFFYNAYLRGKPDAANVAEVTALRDEMSSLLEAQKTTEAMPPGPQVVVDPGGESASADDTSTSTSTSALSGSSSGGADLSATSVDPAAGKGLRLGGIISGSAGVAFVATGVVFMLSASATESDLEEAATNLEVWSQEYADMEKRAERSSTIGTVMLVTGVAAMAGGGVLYFLGNKKRNESRGLASLRLEPTFRVDDDVQAGLQVGWSY